MGGIELLIWLARIGNGDMLTPAAAAADMDVDVAPVGPVPPLPIPDIVPS